MYFAKRRDSSADRALRTGLALGALACALCAASGTDAQTAPASVPAPTPANETFKFVPQANAPGAEETSPDGTIKVSVTTDPDGRPLYAITRGAETIIAPSRLGFLFTDQPKIERGMRIERVTHGKADTTWTQPYGEWHRIRDNHREMRVRLTEVGNLQRSYDIVFRIQDDGVGFRYEVPDQANLHGANIADELTEFTFAEGGTAWWKPAFLWNREEYLYERTPLAAVGTAATPITMKLASGTHVALHEAALVDYASMAVMKTTGNTLKTVLTPGSGRPKVVKQGSWTTPWRTLIIASDAPGLYMSHLELNLNEPNKLGDVSWVKPGKFVGVWWNMIKGDWTWARGPRHGATTANVKKYIDFASLNKIPGVLVEGWNIGWDGDWAGHGSAMQFARPTEDFDAVELARYARAKNVYIIGHNETGGAATHYEGQFDAAFRYAADHGIPTIKTGYVTDAGQIERINPDGTISREWHEGQWMANHHLRVVQSAAKYKVSIDAHEPIKDTGLRRTYPNWLAREGSRGMEYNAWPGKNPPEHEANLAFTRMLEGPMDFTPGVLSLTGTDNSPILSTIAKQLALYVVLYSPVQMAADTPENYAKYPDAFRFIRDVPVDWEETRVLNGEVGDYATFARRDRNSRDWYIGSITDENARSLTVTLDFLDAGRTYTAEIYSDGPDADYRTDARHAIAIETKQVRKGDTLKLALAPGGGQAIRLRAK
ncbi:glycoside hydrolase family 97 protein [Sphingomonas mollis]|uniref:Glycoside hydrolase family 97 protein n=1 Tax=Sphingomonas mollis TaxID=2795726 RepID=A0ABS0XLL0_9SPHN|nr:glycoside hydrolase family 97 protein [Sphingomonas sp. BT553]MBJ6120928.1 glycoside hydrolase family 97 protein [Sphingomonas sp. BT553]